jgi:hypothetical protein
MPGRWPVAAGNAALVRRLQTLTPTSAPREVKTGAGQLDGGLWCGALPEFPTGGSAELAAASRQGEKMMS